MSLKYITPLKVAATGPFTPPSIPGLILWLDASNFGSITKDGSNKVSQWNDLSVSGNNATQSTSASQPIYNATGLNSLPAITQSGVPQYMSLTSSIPFLNQTFFAVISTVDKTALTSHWGNTITGASATIAANGEYYDSSNYVDFGGESITDNTPFIQSVVMNDQPLNAIPAKNGTTQSITGHLGAAWTGSYNAIGTRNAALWQWNGAYSEFIVYNSNLSPGDVAQVINYLTTKWSIV